MSKILVEIENMYAGYNGTAVLKAIDPQTPDSH